MYLKVEAVVFFRHNHQRGGVQHQQALVLLLEKEKSSAEPRDSALLLHPQTLQLGQQSEHCPTMCIEGLFRDTTVVLPGKAGAGASLWKRRGRHRGIPAGSPSTPGQACSAPTTAALPSPPSSASSHPRDGPKQRCALLFEMLIKLWILGENFSRPNPRCCKR